MTTKLVSAFKKIMISPSYLKVGVKFRIRNLLKYRKNINCIVSSPNNTRFYLGEDRIDEIILHHLFVDFRQLYFPDNLKFNSNDLIIDVGSHHAIYLSELLTRNAGVNAIAIEPDENSIKYIKKNLFLNHLENRVEIVNAAVSGKDGIGSLTRSDEGSWGNSISESFDDKDKTEKINLISLETLVKNSRFKELINSRQGNFKLLKINAEGGEFTILPLIFKAGIFPQFIILMVHPEYGNWEELRNLLLENDYEIKVANEHQNRPAYHCWKN